MFLFPTIPLEKHGLNVTEDVKIKTNELLVLLSHCLSMFVFASQPGLATSDQSSWRKWSTSVCRTAKFVCVGVRTEFWYVVCIIYAMHAMHVYMYMYPLQSFIQETILLHRYFTILFLCLHPAMHNCSHVWFSLRIWPKLCLYHFLLPNFLLWLALHTQETEKLTPEGKR